MQTRTENRDRDKQDRLKRGSRSQEITKKKTFWKVRHEAPNQARKVHQDESYNSKHVSLIGTARPD